MRVIRIDKQLESMQMRPLVDVTGFTLAQDDCLVVCAGFEERALAALDAAIAGSKCFNVLIVEYLPPVIFNCSTPIQARCRDANIPYSVITYDRQDPAGFGDMIHDHISGCCGRVYFDISGMSRLLIVQVLVAVGRGRGSFAGRSVIYTEAGTYPPCKEEVEAEIAKRNADPTFSVMFLSSGVFEVTIVPELSSSAIPLGQTRLIAFPSLDAYQLTALRAELQPSRFSIIHGVPPNATNAWRVDAISRINRLDTIKHDSINTSTLDYRETLRCLLQLYDTHSERERLLISPTGSKMQTVAVGIFRTYMDDIQIVYPTPKDFRSPTSYTKGIGKIHLLSLDEFAKEFA